MKILLISYLDRPVTSRVTAARPRLVYDIATRLVRHGHAVSLLGTGDSRIPGVKVIPVIPKALHRMGAFENPFYTHTLLLSKMVHMLEGIGDRFDVIHNHCRPETLNLLASDHIRTPIVTTLHNEITSRRDEVFSLFTKAYFVGISKAQKRLAGKTRIFRVVYNGVDPSIFRYREKKGDYLLWIGRLSKARGAHGDFMDPKGVRWAIRLARETGLRLVLSGNVEDPEFFDKDVKPFLGAKIRWVGPVGPEQPLSKREVADLMGRARAFLMTPNLFEPFGLVVAESMSCGTPVITFDRGGPSEIVKDGVTGFVVSPRAGVRGLAAACAKIDEIDPAACRARVEKYFTLDRMVEAYERVYRELPPK